MRRQRDQVALLAKIPGASPGLMMNCGSHHRLLRLVLAVVLAASAPMLQSM